MCHFPLLKAWHCAQLALSLEKKQTRTNQIRLFSIIPGAGMSETGPLSCLPPAKVSGIHFKSSVRIVIGFEKRTNKLGEANCPLPKGVKPI
jgi:hypothetical protein